MSSFSNLLQEDFQKYLHSIIEEPIEKIALKKHPFAINAKEVAQQVLGLKKAKQKLPTWFATKNILYPSKLSIEQTSSEKTAHYKATIIEGNKLFDATGGFGIDSYFFSKKINQVHYAETNSELCKIVKHNFKMLGVENCTFLDQDAITYLSENETFYDIIYIDPARRDLQQKKVFILEDCSPNIVEHLDLFLKKANEILIKTSPLFDLQKGIKQLQYVFEIHIVAVENEVKEILWRVSKLKKKEIKIVCVNILTDKITSDSFFWNEKVVAKIHLPLTYLYEPNAAWMKSGRIDFLAQKKDLFKLHSHTHLLTSAHQIAFPGRVFEIIQIIPYQKKELKDFVENKKYNISVRNFPLTVTELRKKWKIKDGGDLYLFFVTNALNNKIVLFCKKIVPIADQT